MHRTLGVDLTQVPGLETLTITTFFSEVGQDLSRFPSAHHFVFTRDEERYGNGGPA